MHGDIVQHTGRRSTVITALVVAGVIIGSTAMASAVGTEINGLPSAVPQGMDTAFNAWITLDRDDQDVSVETFTVHVGEQQATFTLDGTRVSGSTAIDADAPFMDNTVSPGYGYGYSAGNGRARMGIDITLDTAALSPGTKEVYVTTDIDGQTYESNHEELRIKDTGSNTPGNPGNGGPSGNAPR